MTMTATLDLPQETNHPSHTEHSPRLVINGLLACVFALVILVAFVGFGSGAAATGPLRPASNSSVVNDTIEVYVVQPGDTLWAIAERVAPAGTDLRPIVDHLADESGGAALEIGQHIVLDHATIAGLS